MNSSKNRRSPLNLMSLAAGVLSAHEHVTVADVHDHRVTLAVNEEPFPWHEHPNSDELFLVLEGTLRLELSDGTVIDLAPSDVWLVPAGTRHRTTPLGRCVNLVFERGDTETRLYGDEDEG